MTPREAAVHFEAVKVKLSQDKNGILLTLAIHPDDVPESLVRAFVGSRWVCALVRLDDHEMPAPSPAQVDGSRAVQSAAMLCRTPAFQAFLEAQGIATAATEPAATEGLRRYLGIASRADLKTDAAARGLLAGLKDRFNKGRSTL